MFLKKNGILRLEIENFSLANTIESSNRKVMLSASVELSLLTSEFLSSARWNSILRPEDASIPRRIVYSLTRSWEFLPVS